MNARVIVVDDEQDFLDSVKRGLITSGMTNVRIESDPRSVVAAFESGEVFDIALIDITMPELNGIDLLEVVKRISPATECIMVTALDEARTAMNCLKKGAYDYLVKPLSKEELIFSVNRALERRRMVEILNLGKSGTLPELSHPEAFESITTRSPTMLRVMKEAELHADSDIPILITGETGTGKELLSRAIHAASPRARAVFTPVNMESMNATLFDAQFFGHKRGAFTGAEKEHSGYLESSNRGTLFLDEIGNLSLELQGKLLRVLQEGEFIKIGSSRPQRVNIRFISATNANMDRLMARGQFRKDLYYRLKGGWLHLPPLRDRRDDIPLLINRFVEEYGAFSDPAVDEDALRLLMDYDYPGNIRELKAIIQSAVNLAQGRPIAVNHLPHSIKKRKPSERAGHAPEADSMVTLQQMEKYHILKVYRSTGRNKSQTARILGIALNTLRKKLDAYGAG